MSPASSHLQVSKKPILANHLANDAGASSASRSGEVQGSLRVLVVTGVYPTEQCPHAGTFIKSQVDSLIAAGLEVEVIHPKPGPKPLRYAMAAIQVFIKTLAGHFEV